MVRNLVKTYNYILILFYSPILQVKKYKRPFVITKINISLFEPHLALINDNLQQLLKD